MCRSLAVIGLHGLLPGHHKRRFAAISVADIRIFESLLFLSPIFLAPPFFRVRLNSPTPKTSRQIRPPHPLSNATSISQRENLGT